MKLHIASDLHLEFIEKRFPNFTGLASVDAQVLMLAGDIHHDTKAVSVFAGWPTPVVYVHGNHELYNADIDTLPANMAELTDPLKVVHNYDKGVLSTSSPTVKYLQRQAYVQNGVRFLGCCLWTDYALIHRDMVKRCMQEAGVSLNDHRLISNRAKKRTFSPEDAAILHTQDLAWLGQQLSMHFDGPTVVMTHHAPHFKSIHQKYAGMTLNAAFASDLSTFILQHQPALWIHGHTHDSFDYMVGNTRVIANPRGYPLNLREAANEIELTFENRGFKPDLVVTL